MKSSTKCHCCDEGIYISMSDVHDKYLQIAQSKQADPLNQRDINKEDNYNNCCPFYAISLRSQHILLYNIPLL